MFLEVDFQPETAKPDHNSNSDRLKTPTRTFSDSDPVYLAVKVERIRRYGGSTCGVMPWPEAREIRAPTLVQGCSELFGFWIWGLGLGFDIGVWGVGIGVLFSGCLTY